MKKFTIPCDFNGKKIKFPVYVGQPSQDMHPLHYQAQWISSQRGGTIPQEVMDSFEKLHKISKDNNVSFEDLCVYALGEATKQQGELPVEAEDFVASGRLSDIDLNHSPEENRD